jgi:hypothetical protein
VWPYVRVATPPKTMAEPRFRRRIPLELTATEIDLLETAQPGYGTKRATLVAGLEALTALDEARAEAVRVAAERDAALAELAEAAERARKAESTLEHRGATTKAATQTAKAATTKLERSLARSDAQLDETRQRLSKEQETRLRWQNAYEQAEPQIVDALRCPRCKAWAEPDQWDTRPAEGGGEIIFHQPCGYHQDGVVNPTTIMGYRSGN